jgi:hypothetical protein
MNRRFALGSIGFLGLVGARATSAQQDFPGLSIPECFRGEPYDELVRFFGRWNTKELHMQKSNFDEDFRRDVTRIAEQFNKPKPWAQQRLQAWGSLPDALAPERDLAKGSQVLLLGLYSENADEFVKSYADSKQREHRLNVKLYFILSLAQRFAAEAPQIRPSHTFAAVRQGWTGLWPFCPQASKV